MLSTYVNFLEKKVIFSRNFHSCLEREKKGDASKVRDEFQNVSDFIFIFNYF